MINSKILNLLNAGTAEERLRNLRTLLDNEDRKPEIKPRYANNHIHTFYSFSPYSPTAAVWFARARGLPVAGIMDHDTVAGASEFRKAAALAGIGATCGFELRVSVKGTAIERRRTNNPDQTGVTYMAFHSIKESYFGIVQERLSVHREKRNARSRIMTANAASVTGIALDFDTDVVSLSRYAEGGAVTERHILYALVRKMLPDGDMARQYKLLGELKSGLVPQIYVPAEDELMSFDEAVEFAREIDAVLCYPYLGDVTESPTGDKAAAKYEDEYLDELFAFLNERGVRAVSYMPSRNTDAQLDRLMKLCGEYGFLQISGEDINSPGQDFICERLGEAKFKHLVNAAWDLVNREK